MRVEMRDRMGFRIREGVYGNSNSRYEVGEDPSGGYLVMEKDSANIAKLEPSLASTLTRLPFPCQEGILE